MKEEQFWYPGQWALFCFYIIIDTYKKMKGFLTDVIISLSGVECGVIFFVDFNIDRRVWSNRGDIIYLKMVQLVEIHLIQDSLSI